MKTINRATSNGQSRGISFILVLMTISLLIIISFTLVTLNTLNLHLVAKNRDSVKAFWASQAGISDALAQLKLLPSWSAGFLNKDMPDKNGNYTVTFTVGPTPYSKNNIAGSTSVTGWNNTIVPANCAHIVSVGTVGTVRKSTKISQIIVQGSSGSFFQYPFAASGGITANRGFLSDSFDSSVGTYAATHTNSGGTIMTNSTAVNSINIGATSAQRSYVYGDLIIGPNGNPNSAISTSQYVTVSGSKYAAPTAYTFPEITATPGNNDLTYSSGVNYLPSGAYEDLRVRSGAQLILTGTQYTFKSITLQNSSPLIIQSGSDPVTIYIDGNLSGAGGIIRNDTQKANYLMIYATDNCSAVSLGTSFYGAVFARNATLSPTTNSDIYGAVVVNNISGANNSRIHFDKALLTVSVPGYGGSGNLVIKSHWTQ